MNPTQAKYHSSWSTQGSAQRNAEPICLALQPFLKSIPPSSTKPRILEVASGFGIQISQIAQNHPQYQFQPTEADSYLCHQIDQQCQSLDNVIPAHTLDVAQQDDWRNLIFNTCGEFDAILICNLTHVSPWHVTESLFRNLDPRVSFPTRKGPSQSVLSRSKAWIAVYGAFNELGQYTSPGNCTVSGRS